MPDNSNKNQTKSKNEPKDQRKPRQGKSQASERKAEKKAETTVKPDSENKYDIVTRSSKVKLEPPEVKDVLNNDVSLNISENSDAKYKKKEITSNWAKYDAPIETYEEYEELEDMGSDYEVYDKKKRRKKRKYFNYTQESMIAAIKDTRSGVSVSVAAKTHNVPKTSLLNKAAGLRPISRKMGRNSYLDKELEHRLAEWIKSITAAGFRITKKQLLDSAKDMIQELNIDNPFKDDRPGKRWFCCFLFRNRGIGPLIGLAPMISSITTEPDIRLLKWFKRISNYISDNNHEEIFQNPKRVFNAMETLVLLNPKRNKVILPRWPKINKEDEFVSVLLTGNAAGDLLPPMLSFKCTNDEADNSVSIPCNWTAQISETGCVTEEILFDYISNVFYKYLQENDINRPVILFIDSRYETMMSYKICTFCTENEIVLLGLDSKETHVIQPLEVTVVKALKPTWIDIRYTKNNSAVNFDKGNFSSAFDTAVESLKSETVVNGFRKCGLVPWNPGRVIRKFSLGFTELEKKVPEIEAGIQFIEKYLNKEKIDQFKTIQDVSHIKQEDKSLFMFYKHVNDMLSDVQFMSQVCQPTINDEIDSEMYSSDENDEQTNICVKRPTKRSTPPLKLNDIKKIKITSNTFKFRELQNKFNKIDNIGDSDIKEEYLEEYSDSDDNNFELITDKDKDTKELLLVVAEDNETKLKRNKDVITCQICKFPISSDEDSNKCLSCQNWSCFICCDGYKYSDYFCYKCVVPEN